MPAQGAVEGRSAVVRSIESTDVWDVWSRVREHRPLVHNITNYVAMDIAANVLLAAGASPAMVHAQEEVADFAPVAGALTINVGTLSPDWAESMRLAARAAAGAGVPWVLDPVAVGLSPFRTKVVTELLALRPTVVRGNASEILTLAGETADAPRGVDSAHSADDAVEAARALSRTAGTTVAVTGAVDRVTDGERVVEIEGGHPLMALVTALGCSATALAGAFLAVEADPVLATTASLAVLGLAGSRAGADAAGPGSLRWRLLDELHSLGEDDVVTGVRLR